MPVLDEASYLVKRATATQATISADKLAPTVAPGGLKLPNGVAKPTSAPLADLLDLSSDGAPASTTTSTTTPNGFLQDLLGIGGVSTGTTGILFASISVLSCAVSMLACFSDYIKRAKGLY
jgi:AP-1 complex subunit gamma-1